MVTCWQDASVPKVISGPGILFHWVTQFLFYSFLFCSDFLHLNREVPTIQCSKVPTNFYSARSHNFCSAHFCSVHFCSTVIFLHLNWGIPTIKSPKVQTNFYSAGSHNFCSSHFCFALTFMHLNWRPPLSKVQRCPQIFIPLGHTIFVSTHFCSTHFCSAHFCSTGPPNFCSAHSCSALTFMYLNWRPLPSKVQRSPPIFICRVPCYCAAVSYTHSLG